MIRGLILAQRTRITPGFEKMEQTKKLICWKLFTKTWTVYTFDAFLQSQANVHSKMQIGEGIFNCHNSYPIN